MDAVPHSRPNLLEGYRQVVENRIGLRHVALGSMMSRHTPFALAALAATLVAGSPLLAAQAHARKAKPAAEDARALPPLAVPFTFTTAGGSGSHAPAHLAASERVFRFTPPGAGDKKAVLLAVSSRVATPARTVVAHDDAAAATLLPVSYDVDLALAWRGFGVQGGYQRADGTLLTGDRQAMDLGVSYGGHRWRTNLMALAERGSPYRFDADSARTHRYGLELGGTYALSSGLAVNGGLRYRLAPLQPTPLDADRPDQTLFVGTSVAF